MNASNIIRVTNLILKSASNLFIYFRIIFCRSNGYANGDVITVTRCPEIIIYVNRILATIKHFSCFPNYIIPVEKFHSVNDILAAIA